MATGFFLLDNKNRVQQYGNPRRGGSRPSGTIVIHTAENVADQIGGDLGAESVARYCLTRSDYGAYHRLVDADSIIRMAPFGYETWQCRVTNPWSIGISMAVRAGDWKKYGADYETRVLRNAARAAAEAVRSLKKDWGITVPIKHISGTAARNKQPGFTGHGETDPGRRSDPGSDFDWNRFLGMVREELSGNAPIDTEEFLMALSDSAQNKLAEDANKAAIRATQATEKLDRIEDTLAAQRPLDLKYMAASAARETQAQKEIAGLTEAFKVLAGSQGLPVEATLDAIREAIKGITITVAAN